MNTQFHKMALYGITALIGALVILVAADQGLSRAENAYVAAQV